MRRAGFAALGALCLAAAATRSARAQSCVPPATPPNVGISLAPDPLPVAPHMFASVTNVDAARRPVNLRLDISLNSNFGLLTFSDSIQADTGTFIVRRLLPQNDTVFFRWILSDRNGCALGTNVFATRHTGAYLTLVQPNSPTGQSLTDATPTFIWRSARVDLPPGPWRYDLSIINVASGNFTLFQGLSDTSFTPSAAQALEFQTSYRWSVKAYLQNGSPVDTVRVSSSATFTVVPSGPPGVTLLYQNFPNPFPTSYSQTTCIWFDLSAPATVKLTVHTIHGDKVRTLIPGVRDAQMAAGRYGRGTPSGGCDGVQVWDGKADDGRYVPSGVYLLIFEANGLRSVKKILWRGI